LYITNRP